MISKEMKPFRGKFLIALLPIFAVLAAWVAWELKFVPLLDAYGDQGTVLEKQFDRLDRNIASGEITQNDAIKKLKNALIIIQDADEKIAVSVKSGMIFLFLAVGIGAIVGTIRIIFLELRNGNENKES